MAAVPPQASLRNLTATLWVPAAQSPLRVRVSDWPAACGGGGGEGAADLLAVDADRVLRRALVGVLADLQDQRVGAGAGREGDRVGGRLAGGRRWGGRRAAGGEGLHGRRQVPRQGVGDDGGVGAAHVLGVRRAAAPIHPRQVVGGHVDAGGRAVRPPPPACRRGSGRCFPSCSGSARTPSSPRAPRHPPPVACWPRRRRSSRRPEKLPASASFWSDLLCIQSSRVGLSLMSAGWARMKFRSPFSSCHGLGAVHPLRHEAGAAVDGVGTVRRRSRCRADARPRREARLPSLAPGAPRAAGIGEQQRVGLASQEDVY